MTDETRCCNISESTGQLVAAHPSFDGDWVDVDPFAIAQFIQQQSSQSRRPSFGDLSPTILLTTDELPTGPHAEHDKRWLASIDGLAFDIQRRATSGAATITVRHVRPVDMVTVLEEFREHTQ
jgi:hypothetical protein